ncbi:MAG: CFI-box-CTERM domain-containing protein [Planctomycetota bacterium]|nr:CFI-box-CTERM domain-containing protein [Planctomycetota bacterium]
MNTYTERELTGNPLLYRSVYIDTRVSGATHWDIEPPAAIGFPGLHANDEIAVQSALWDIFDPDNETWDSAFSFSGGKTGEDAVWDVYRSLQTLPSNNQITVEDFWFQWFDLGYGNAVTMDSIFNFHLDMRFYEDAFEDNDRRLDSTPLTDDGTTLNATFFPEDDEDWYSLAVIHDMQYTVSTSELVNGADTVVTVYNRTGDTVYGTNDNRHASTRESRVTFTPPYDQTVYIKVVQTPSRTYAELGGYKISAVEDGSGEPGDPAPGDGDGGGGGGGCFVATAAFGTMGAQNVRTLCSVRDNSLASSATGADITAYYYYVSPDIAEEMTSPIRALVRTFID